MANLYEIDNRLVTLFEDGFDLETGEILEDYDLKKAFDEVSMELNQKIENIGAFYKNLLSDANQIKEEEAKLKRRRQIIENKAERLKKYLDDYLRTRDNNQKYFNDTTGEIKFHKFESPKCVITYRNSENLDIYDLNKIPSQYIKDRVIGESDVKKTDIKNYLKNHTEENIDGVNLVKNKNIQIK